MFHFYVRTYAKNICMHGKMHICIYVQMQTCFASYANVYVRTYARTYMQTCLRMYLCTMYLRIHISMYLRTYASKYLWTGVQYHCIYVSVYLCIFVYHRTESYHRLKQKPLIKIQYNVYLHIYTDKAHNHLFICGPFCFKHQISRKVEPLVSRKTSKLTKLKRRLFT